MRRKQNITHKETTQKNNVRIINRYIKQPIHFNAKKLRNPKPN